MESSRLCTLRVSSSVPFIITVGALINEPGSLGSIPTYPPQGFIQDFLLGRGKKITQGYSCLNKKIITKINHT